MYVISTLGNSEIAQIKGTKRSKTLMGGLGTSTKHCLFSQLQKNLIISKHRIFGFALLTCLVLVKVNHYQYKLFQLRCESHDLICIRHRY